MSRIVKQYTVVYDDRFEGITPKPHIQLLHVWNSCAYTLCIARQESNIVYECEFSSQ